MFGGIRMIPSMTHLSVDPACNTSLLVNKLVERFILWFAGGNPRQGIRSLHSLCIHRAQLLFGSPTASCQVELLLVGPGVGSMCGESLQQASNDATWAVSVQIDSRPFCKHSYHLPLHPNGNKDSKSPRAAGLHLYLQHWKVKLKDG